MKTLVGSFAILLSALCTCGASGQAPAPSAVLRVAAGLPVGAHIYRGARQLTAGPGTALAAGDRISAGATGHVEVGIAGRALIRIEKGGAAVVSNPAPGAPPGERVDLTLLRGVALVRASGFAQTGGVVVTAGERVVTGRDGAWAIALQGAQVRMIVAEGRAFIALASQPEATTMVAQGMAIVSSGPDNLPSDAGTAGEGERAAIARLEQLGLKPGSHAAEEAGGAGAAAPAAPAAASAAPQPQADAAAPSSSSTPAPTATRQSPTSLKSELAALPYHLVWECYLNGNFELYTSRADGSEMHNLTNTPEIHEHDPHPSPNGRHIAYTVDRGEGRDTVRSLWVMNSDGTDRGKVADFAREPFWCPDSRHIGYLPQLYRKFSVTECYNKGMVFVDIVTGQVTPHPNSDGISAVYNPSYSRNDKWIAVVANGTEDGLRLIEAHGNRIIDLHMTGCRPNLAPDCKHIAWGHTDHDLYICPIDLSSDNPVVGDPTLVIHDTVNKVYHIHWSPDSNYVAFARGPNGEGDLTKAGSFQSPNERIGVYAAGWDIYVVSAHRTGVLDLATATDADVARITTNGASNKQPEWIPASQ